MVDDEDFEFLNQWSWYLSTSGYGIRKQHVKLGKKRYTNRSIWMHRLLNRTPKDLFTDHINQDKLDNRKENLRTVTKSQNGINRPKQLNNSSGIKEIIHHSTRRGWSSEIMIEGERIYLGYFTKLNEAIAARLEAEKVYHAI